METKFKIGDRVRNIGLSWNSTFTRKYSNYQDIGIEGVVKEAGKSDNIEANAYLVVWDNGLECGKTEQDLELVEKFELKKQNQQIVTNQMKYFKTKQILGRSITVCVAVENGQVNTGYAVRRMDDAENVELGKRISLGRASSAKTNLTKGMSITPSLTEKYILAAIADKVLSDIENGKVVIKGIV